jgi:hypothetical protein
LELFAHKKYKVHTHNLLLEGSGDNYTISHTDEYMNGCSITIYIQGDEDFGNLYSYARDVAEKIETNCQIYVDGHAILCRFPKGEFRKTLDVGDVYVNEDLPTSSYCSVRMNGIWMFQQYVGAEMPHITLELSADSISAMTSNRDGLKSGSLESANQYFQRLASDRRSALFPDKVEIKIHAKGTDGEMIEPSDDDMEFIKNLPSERQAFANMAATFFSLKADGMDETLTKMRINAGNISKYDYTELKYFGFRWDSVHKFEKGKEKEAYQFLDGNKTNAKRAKTLLTMWGETLKQVMIDTRNYTKFTVGYSWDDNRQAIREKDGNKLSFYLHPAILDEYPLTNKTRLAKKLHLLACHEVAHIQTEYHDEYFMSGMERNVEASWDSEKIYDRIAKIK